MPLVRTAYLAALSLGLAAVLHAPSAAAQTPPCGTVLVQSIQLTSSMYCPNTSPALIIGADNVRIDLNGYEISGNGGIVFQPNFFLIYAAAIKSRGYNAVQVIGPGRIINFLYEVWIIGGRRHVVADIRGQSAAGVFLSGASDAQVLNNELGYGVRIHGDEGPPWFTPVGPSIRNQVIGNQIGTAAYRAGVVSISGCGAHKNLVRDNTVLGQMFLSEGATLNLIHGNRVHSSTNHASAAVNVGEAYANDIVQNIIDSDGEVGISIEPQQYPQCTAGGQPGRNGDDNYIHANIFQNGSTGVRVRPWTPVPWTLGTGNVILGNTFLDMTVAGQHFAAGTANNDGRNNKYSNVAVEVEDFGMGNLWP